MNVSLCPRWAGQGGGAGGGQHAAEQGASRQQWRCAHQGGGCQGHGRAGGMRVLRSWSAGRSTRDVGSTGDTEILAAPSSLPCTLTILLGREGCCCATLGVHQPSPRKALLSAKAWRQTAYAGIGNMWAAIAFWASPGGACIIPRPCCVRLLEFTVSINHCPLPQQSALEVAYVRCLPWTQEGEYCKRVNSGLVGLPHQLA